MRKAIAALAGVLMVASACMGVELTQKIKTAEGFTIRIPADWKPIPKDVLDSYCADVAKMAPKAPKQTWDYGFQLASSQKDMDYPYIFVAVKHTGKVPESAFASAKREQAALEGVVAKTQESVSSFISDARLGEVRYDSERHILWAPITVNVAQVGEMKGLGATLLTEDGFIMIQGCGKAQDWETYGPVFEAIVKGVTLPDSLDYKPGLTPAEIERQVGGAITFFLLFGTAFFVARQTRKNREGAKKTAWVAWPILTAVMGLVMHHSYAQASIQDGVVAIVAEIIGELFVASLITGLVLALAAGWRPWRRKRTPEPPELPS